jgi:hypothetical protein
MRKSAVRVRLFLRPLETLRLIGPQSVKLTHRRRSIRWAQNRAQRKKGRFHISSSLLVRKGGLEPPRFYPPDPKSGASANSATFATGAKPRLYKRFSPVQSVVLLVTMPETMPNLGFVPFFDLSRSVYPGLTRSRGRSALHFGVNE